jgi:O-antigen/teichoic acid export membrane protein
LRKLRITFTSFIFALLGIAAFFGPWLVEFLYDDRYLTAGVIVVLIACFGIPRAIGMTYDAAALAVGDSKSYFLLTFVRATLATIGLVVGVSIGGLVGALVGQFLAVLASYPALVWLSVRLGVWDRMHDAAFAFLGSLIFVAAIFWNWEAIVLLAQS